MSVIILKKKKKNDMKRKLVRLNAMVFPFHWLPDFGINLNKIFFNVETAGDIPEGVKSGLNLGPKS